MQITVHLGLLALVMLCAFGAGLLFRFLQVRSLSRQILELEREKMHDHAEILQLQKQMAALMQERNPDHAAAQTTRIVPLKDKGTDQPNNGNHKRASQ